MSWKTTTTGAVAIIMAVCGALKVLVDDNPAPNPDWPAPIAAVMAGIGLITARDNKVTSEEAGAK